MGIQNKREEEEKELMKDEELRAQINELIKGEIQEGINDYIDSKEESEKTGLGFVQSEDEQLKVNVSNLSLIHI